MFRNRFVTVTVTFVVALTGTANADGEDAPAQSVPVEVFPLPANTTFERHMVGGEGVVTGVAGERLIYSNTLGAFAAALGAGRLVSDDIATTAPNGCKLRRLEFPVVGKVDPAGVGGPYSLDFALYPNCPGSLPLASRPGPIIENSAVHLDFPDDGARLISFVPPEGTDVDLLTNFWLGVKFSRNNAGVMVGAPAMKGFSADRYDFPGFPCNAYLGGFPGQPHASFNLEIYADADCPQAFVGYKNNKPSGSSYNPGANIVFADDIQLGVNGCQMVAYEVAVKGVGFFTFDLRELCDGDVIPGTQNSFTYYAPATDVKIARFSFDSPIAIPRDLWFSVKVNNETGGVVVTGQQAVIGRTEDLFGLVDYYGCSLIDGPNPYIHAALNLAITCAGAPAVGACCDMILSDANGEAVCREVPQMNCPWPPRFSASQPGWVEGATCDPNPFPLPCGVAACCRPDDVCENLTQNHCNAVPPIDAPRQWQRGRYCGVDGQRCPLAACLARDGECVFAHEDPGCSNADCCTKVCRLDPWCCSVEWDRLCVEQANTNSSCTHIVDHDNCWSLFEEWRSLPVEADSVTFFANTNATESDSDPGFCCRSDAPGDQGFGTVWFKFVATDTSARVSTCDSDPAKDSLINVFAVGDPTTEESACASLIPIACSDDVEECGGGRHGKICVRNLTPGQTYYVMVSAKTPETKGVYQLDIRSPCFDEPIWNAGDCDGDGVQDGCKIGRDSGTDCNLNRILDECEITEETSLDCNGDLLPDECTSVLKTLRPDSPSLSFGQSLAVDGEWLLVGDPNADWDDAPPPGAAYLFRRTGLTSWERIAKMSSPETGMVNFGESVTITDGRALITARQLNPLQTDVAGAVYEFACGQDGCRYETKLQISDPRDPTRVVCRVSTSGDRVAVSGCWTGGSFNQPVAAAVYVFQRKGLGWVEEGKLTSPGRLEPSIYGRAIALDRNWLAIGSGLESHSDYYALGAVYLYKYDGVKWGLVQRATSPSEYDDRYFGAAIDLRRDRLVVAAVSPSDLRDIAKRTGFVFRPVGDAWIPDGNETVLAGADYIDEGSVSFINDGVFVMGVNGGGDRATFAEVVERVAGGGWRAVGSLRAPPDLAVSEFAGVVGGSRDVAVIGAWVPGYPWEPPLSAVYSFAVPSGDCNQNGVGDGCDLRDGTSADCDANGVPDECEVLPPFDYDFEGDVDLIDLAGFQRCFTGPGPAAVAPCCRMFDSEPDGDVDGADFVAFRGVFKGP